MDVLERVVKRSRLCGTIKVILTLILIWFRHECERGASEVHFLKSGKHLDIIIVLQTDRGWKLWILNTPGLSPWLRRDLFYGQISPRDLRLEFFRPCDKDFRASNWTILNYSIEITRVGTWILVSYARTSLSRCDKMEVFFAPDKILAIIEMIISPTYFPTVLSFCKTETYKIVRQDYFFGDFLSKDFQTSNASHRCFQRLQSRFSNIAYISDRLAPCDVEKFFGFTEVPKRSGDMRIYSCKKKLHSRISSRPKFFWNDPTYQCDTRNSLLGACQGRTIKTWS